MELDITVFVACAKSGTMNKSANGHSQDARARLEPDITVFATCAKSGVIVKPANGYLQGAGARPEPDIKLQCPIQIRPARAG